MACLSLFNLKVKWLDISLDLLDPLDDFLLKYLLPSLDIAGRLLMLLCASSLDHFALQICYLALGLSISKCAHHHLGGSSWVLWPQLVQFKGATRRCILTDQIVCREGPCVIMKRSFHTSVYVSLSLFFSHPCLFDSLCIVQIVQDFLLVLYL